MICMFEKAVAAAAAAAFCDLLLALFTNVNMLMLNMKGGGQVLSPVASESIILHENVGAHNLDLINCLLS